MQNFVKWIQTASLFMQRQMVFTKILRKMLKEDLTLQILKYHIDIPLPKGKNKKIIGLMKDELGGQIIKQFVAIRANI